MNHLTSDQIQEYSDAVLSEHRRNEIELHLHGCPECEKNVKAFRRMESSIRDIPHERVSPDFTRRVMKRLRIQESPSIVWSIFKNLAPVFGLVIIIGIVYGGLKYTGLLEGSGVGDSVDATTSVFNSFTGGVSSGVSFFNGWIKNIFPFLYAKNSYGLTIFLIIFFVIVGLLDRFIFIPLIKRRN